MNYEPSDAKILDFFCFNNIKSIYFKLELEAIYGVMGRIWQSNMELDLEEKETEFLFKHVKFEAMMKYDLTIYSFIKFVLTFS